MFTIPTDISGCFVWLRAHDIGTVNNGPVCYWQDMSGSGNHMTVDSLAASSTACPKYIINALNGYATVRFNGSTNWLSATGNYNAGTNTYYFGNLPASSLTHFIVYKSNNVNVEQILSCNETSRPITLQNNINFSIATDSTLDSNPSGWVYRWKAAGAAGHILSSIGIMVASGEWTLRTDRWRIADNVFVFSKNGTDISTGTTPNMFQDQGNYLKIGATYRTGAASFFLDGEIAEIVEYSRRLNDVETNFVEDYLRQKYNLAGTAYFPLFMYGEADPTGLMYINFPMFVSGGPFLDNNSITLFTSAASSINSNIKLYTAAASSINKSTTLYMNPADITNSGTTLYTMSSAVSSSSIKLYTVAASSINNSFNLYTFATFNINSGSPLYISASTQSTSGLYLYTSAASLWDSGLNLYIAGTGIYNTIPLYTMAASSINLSTTIYTSGSQGEVSKGMTLYMNPATIINSGLSLYMNPATNFFNFTTLYTKAANVSTLTSTLFLPGSIEYGMFPLYTYGYDTYSSGTLLFISAASIASSSTTLWTAGLSSLSGMMPLFIKQLPTPQLSGGVSLYTAAPDNNISGLSQLYNNISLYMYSDGVHETMPLFLQNNEQNAVPFAGMPLFITGPITSGSTYNSFPLYLANFVTSSGRFLKLTITGEGQMIGASVDSMAMPLFLNAPPGNYASVPLFMDTYSSEASPVNLFAFGVNIGSSGIPFFIGGIGSTGYLPLYMAGPLVGNSGVSMYVEGKPEINSNITFYTHGF